MEPTPITLTEILEDAEHAFKRARADGSVVATELGPMAVRHEAVRNLLRDSRMRPSFSAFLEGLGVTSGPFYEWMSISPLDMEGEEHRRWRALVTRTFTPQSVERLRPYLKVEARRLATELATHGRAEFVAEFARKLPSLGLCELIGVPLEDRDRFGVWADAIGLGFNLVLLPTRIADIDAALSALQAYARDLIATRRSAPRDDLVSRLAQAGAEEGADPELIHMTVSGLVFAGHETTKNQLGWMIVALSQAPHEWDAVAKDPARAKDVIEEVLRFRSAVTTVGRLVLEEVEFFGVKYPVNTTILGSLWSANRDEHVFAQAAHFNSEANRNAAQIAFGQGAHHCLGAALARAELQEALIELSAAWTCPVLEEGATYMPAIGISGPTALPIRFEARR